MNGESNELNVGDLDAMAYQERIADAIDLASDQDQMTWLTDATGKRIAAIVPVDVAESHEQMISGLLGR